jgi:hypothetical protein
LVRNENIVAGNIQSGNMPLNIIIFLIIFKFTEPISIEGELSVIHWNKSHPNGPLDSPHPIWVFENGIRHFPLGHRKIMLFEFAINIPCHYNLKLNYFKYFPHFTVSYCKFGQLAIPLGKIIAPKNRIQFDGPFPNRHIAFHRLKLI